MRKIKKKNNPQNDNLLRELIENAKVVAVIGHSANPKRASYRVSNYLRDEGYKIIPVNPSIETIDGKKSYNALKDIPEHIDIVQVFRPPQHLLGVVEESIEIGAGAVWGQFGVEDEAAASVAKKANMPIVMDRCLKVEHKRLIKNIE